MPFPSTSTAVVRKDLAGLLEPFDGEMDRRGFVGNQILPMTSTPNAAGRFPKLAPEELLRFNVNVGRSPDGTYKRDDYKWVDDNYTTQEWGGEGKVDDRLKNMYRTYFDLEAVAQKKTIDRVLRAQELRIAALIFDTTRWTGASYFLSAANKWTSPVLATPIDDVDFAKRKVRTNFGRWPNTIVFNYSNLMYLRNTAQVQERIASSGAGQSIKASEININQIASVFDIQKVLVAGAVKNTNYEGRSVAYADIWSDSYAWVGYTSDSEDISDPTVGRVFHWDEDGGTPLGHVETYRDETRRSDIVRVRHEVFEKILFTECGFLIQIQ